MNNIQKLQLQLVVAHWNERNKVIAASRMAAIEAKRKADERRAYRKHALDVLNQRAKSKGLIAA